uniref:Germin-like protein 9-2 n=2 Tax=Nicotiana TaxID=4085 RepID=A0A1S4B9Z5_TOBAC|nr:PREDICTED: putative germin-like protein 9-2 [Nicotiana sylvestris]XP_016485677.1 PREDICTED: putative germin-like protein 9-2 [Nicotiana tabacum]
MAQAGDPDILTDFIVSENQTGDTIDGNFFTFTGTRGIFDSVITCFKLTKASKAKFPDLDGPRTSLTVLLFPGLVHYQYYTDWNKSASAVSAFGDANVGTISHPAALFATCVDDQILAKSFKTDHN